jgi:hypothetical protein
LQPGDNINCKIIAINVKGSSEASVVITGALILEPPNKPTNLAEDTA